ncbi:MAG: allophanate hydrolase subunit 1 [Alteromonadales bacterium]|nr:allophanate hydrolase subunit 1 [Alteromonadales bacterium]
MKVDIVNEDSFIIILSDCIDLSLTAQIAALVKQIQITLEGALLDITPSYTTILVQVNLLKISPLVAQQLLISLCDKSDKPNSMLGKQIELPVYYDVSVGWDLQKVALDNNLSIDEVIKYHKDKTYQVCAVGFAPGFAFLAELDEQIAQPRHQSPRAFVPAGSVAIADRQTAVYPSDSPGGWHIIGNCPTQLFDITSNPISPFEVGDTVKFTAINQQQFIALGGKIVEQQ